jgi:hypothetical protein
MEIRRQNVARALPRIGNAAPIPPLKVAEAGTGPFARAATSDLEETLNCMALLRLLRPDWVIPAVCALNLAGPGPGYWRGLSMGLVVFFLPEGDLRIAHPFKGGVSA